MVMVRWVLVVVVVVGVLFYIPTLLVVWSGDDGGYVDAEVDVAVLFSWIVNCLILSAPTGVRGRQTFSSVRAGGTVPEQN